MKKFCRYAVIDMESGEVLVVGYKYKDFSAMQPDGCFRRFPCFWRKITIYGKIRIIKDRTCYIFYWVGERPKSGCSVVLKEGKRHFLQGRMYLDNNSNFTPFLRGLGIE